MDAQLLSVGEKDSAIDQKRNYAAERPINT
jgi:hypothetical protein